MHLAATEVIYQDLTFYGHKGFSETNKEKWDVAMSLGEDGRKQIKGNNLEYYFSAIERSKRKNVWLSSKKEMTNGWPKLILLSLVKNQPIITANGFMFVNMKLTTGDR